jgi:protein-S-isoprenylcysteine O-methyltransferase Ste14
MPAVLSPKLSPRSVEAEPRPSTACVFKHFFVSAGVYGLLLCVLALNPWFRGLLSIPLLPTVLASMLPAIRHWSFGGLVSSPAGITPLGLYRCAYVLYLVAALPIFLAFRPRSLPASKNRLMFGAVCRAGRSLRNRARGLTGPPLALSDRERDALTFLLIRLFFGPLMVNSAFIELDACQRLFASYRTMSWLGFLDFGYIALVHLAFLAYSCLFVIGYHTEAGFLRNEIRQVDTRLWRMLVCVICYPPFNQATVSVLGRSFDDPYILVLGDFRSVWTWGLRGLAVFSLVLLIAASVSLFTRASNLTNRGIVTWGPYRYVRHPEYLAENLFWLTTLIPALVPNVSNVYFSWSGYWLSCLCVVAGFIGWGGVYFLRAVAEEHFLGSDPEYAAYCRKVKYRFIPGVY